MDEADWEQLRQIGEFDELVDQYNKVPRGYLQSQVDNSHEYHHELHFVVLKFILRLWWLSLSTGNSYGESRKGLNKFRKRIPIHLR